MNIAIDQEEQSLRLELFKTILSDMDWSLSLSIHYNRHKYAEAKTSLQPDPQVEVCYEDVLIEMIRIGHSITIYDNEDTSIKKVIDLHALNEGIEKIPNELITLFKDEEYDAWTCYDALQYIVFGEVIFG